MSALRQPRSAGSCSPGRTQLSGEPTCLVGWNSGYRGGDFAKSRPRVWEIDRVAADRGRPEVQSRGEMREAVRQDHLTRAAAHYRRFARRHLQRFLSRQKQETPEWLRLDRISANSQDAIAKTTRG